MLLLHKPTQAPDLTVCHTNHMTITEMQSNFFSVFIQIVLPIIQPIYAINLFTFSHYHKVWTPWVVKKNLNDLKKKKIRVWVQINVWLQVWSSAAVAELLQGKICCALLHGLFIIAGYLCYCCFPISSGDSSLVSDINKAFSP